jgi:hypothetical protein
MSYALYFALLDAAMVFAILLMLVVGRRIGARDLARNPEGTQSAFGALEASVLALLGLVLAFTISGATGRFDTRRMQIVDEVNAIGTAYLRLDVLPAAAQPALRDEFRRYLDTRVAAYRKIPDIAAVKQELAAGDALQDKIWKQALDAVRTREAPPYAAILLVPALNAMFDIATTRTMSTQIHVPLPVLALLFVLALTGALLSGYGMAAGKSGSRLHIVCFVVVVAFTIAVIIDIEFPRLGWVRLEAFDQALADLRAKM